MTNELVNELGRTLTPTQTFYYRSHSLSLKSGDYFSFFKGKINKVKWRSEDAAMETLTSGLIEALAAKNMPTTRYVKAYVRLLSHSEQIMLRV